MIRQYALTYAVEFSGLLALLLSYRMAMAAFGPDGFAAFMLVSRGTGMIVPFLALGLAVAVPRFVSRNADQKNRDNFLLIGALAVGALAIVTLLLSICLPGIASRALFDRNDLGVLAIATVLTSGGLALHGIAYSFLRGLLRLGSANALSLVSMSIIPVILLTYSSTPEFFFMQRGILAATISVAMIAIMLKGGSIDPQSLRTDARALISFGAMRLPGDLGFTLIITLPAMIATHADGMVSGGHVAFAISLLNTFGYIFSPVSIIMLPFAARALSSGSVSGLRLQFFLAAGMAVLAGSAFSLAMLAAAPWAIGLLTNADQQTCIALAEPTRIICLGAAPLGLYFCSRSILDAHHSRPVNSILCISALVVMVVAHGVFSCFGAEHASGLALILSLTLLGLVSTVEAARILGTKAVPK